MRTANKFLKFFCSLAVSMMMILETIVPYTVMAAADCSLVFKNIEIGDQIEIYRIATHKDGKFEWEAEVNNWIATNSEGMAYAGLTTEQLQQMTEDRAEEFCQSFLVSCKDEANGIAKLEGYSFEATEEKEEYVAKNMTPGYYIVLPKGKNRIYQLKWIGLNPAETKTIEYVEEAGDYQLPAVESTVTNRTMSDREIALEGDELEINATIKVPTYPNMYATGKRILNATVVIPKGLSYKDNLEISSASGELEYSMGEYTDAVVYQNKEGKILFFQTEDNYYYELSGELLESEGEPEEVLEKYNIKYETEYELLGNDIEVIDDEEATEAEEGQETEEASETEGIEATESVEGTEETEAGEEMNVLGEEDDRYQVDVLDKMKIFVFAIDTKQELSDITIHYTATKDNLVNKTCFFDNLIALSYSVSPLDANRICNLVSTARVKSYGIRITLCEGTGASIDMTTEEKLKKSARLTGAKFCIYKLSNVFEGDVTKQKESSQESDTETESESETEGTEANEEKEPSKVELVYMDEIDKTYEFSYMKELSVDSNGEAAIGGVEETAYLITETVYPSGHTLSEASFLIEANAWTDDTEMEGNCLLEVLWLNFETVYLPGTGSYGATVYSILGGTVALSAMILLLDQCYKKSYKKVQKK